MKPFIRFSKQSDHLYHRHDGKNRKHLFWDFDDTLQRVLLGILKTLVTPDEIATLCVERWKVNLERLAEGSRSLLNSLVETGKNPEFRQTPRDEFIFSQVKQTSRFLYIGCGSGTDCLRLAQKGYRVIGIDTDFRLTRLAKDWARYYRCSFSPVCMDVASLGFSKSFEGFLLEFYGYQPPLGQVLCLQEELANVLSSSGRGIIVAFRKRYASFWYRMGSQYPDSMTHWLMKQAQLDFRFSELDGFAERLLYGLYNWSHSKESLSLELSYAFDVQECFYEQHDPRYVISVVTPKERVDPTILENEHFSRYSTDCSYRLPSSTDIDEILDRIEVICQILESHEQRVVQYYRNDISSPQKCTPLSAVQTDLTEMIDLMEHVFQVSLVP